MAFRLSQGAENVWAPEAETGKQEVKYSRQEVSGANINKGFQEKKGSVFPVKRKLVKTMMADCVAKSLSSLCISPEASSKMDGGSSKMTALSKFPKGKKSMEIVPDP